MSTFLDCYTLNAALAVLLAKSCIFRWKHTIKNDAIQKNSLEKVE